MTSFLAPGAPSQLNGTAGGGRAGQDGAALGLSSPRRFCLSGEAARCSREIAGLSAACPSASRATRKCYSPARRPAEPAPPPLPRGGGVSEGGGATSGHLCDTPGESRTARPGSAARQPGGQGVQAARPPPSGAAHSHQLSCRRFSAGEKRAKESLAKKTQARLHSEAPNPDTLIPALPRQPPAAPACPQYPLPPCRSRPLRRAGGRAAVASPPPSHRHPATPNGASRGSLSAAAAPGGRSGGGGAG